MTDSEHRPTLKLSTKFAPQRHFFEQAVEAGFQYAELWTGVKTLADWQDVAELALQYPLSYTLHFPNRTDLSDEALQQAVELYRALRCQAMVIHEPMYRACAQRIAALDPNVCLAIENHEATPDELEQWIESSQWLTLDVEHVWMLTWPNATLTEFLDRIRPMIRRVAPKLRHVHLPGYLAPYGEHCPMYYAREMVFPVLDTLAEVGFEGFVVSEADIQFQNPNDLRMDVLLFDTWQSGRRVRQPLSKSSV